MIQTPLLSHSFTSGVLSPDGLLESFGPWAFAGVVAVLFIECGLLVGLVLPGDSLLFMVGLFIASDLINVNLVLALIVMSIAAILGNLLGYWVGAKVGPRLFRRPDSRIFKQHYVDQTHDFLERYGARSIVLARFTPIVRTLITLMAGIAKMDFRTYMTFSSIGGALWVVIMTLLGYYLGTVPLIHDNLELFTLAVVALSVIPIIHELRKASNGSRS